MSSDEPLKPGGGSRSGGGPQRTYRTYRSGAASSPRNYRNYKRKKPLWKKFLIGLVVIMAIVVLSAGSLFAYVLYFRSPQTKTSKEIAKVEKVITKPTIPNEPLNILVLGSDKRPKEPARSDTIIIVRVYPKEKKAVLLSIPRDYRVRIPGYGKRKINAAYAMDGPPLTIETVEEATGLKINHYAEVDFMGFKKLVNALGGIDITTDEKLYENRVTFKIDLEPGTHHLKGSEALAFVRFRHNAEGDFGRIKRQQQFAKALLDRTLSVATLTKIPQLIDIVQSATLTDMTTAEMVSLAWLARSIPKDNLMNVTLPGEPDMINGVSFVVPDEEKMNELLDVVKQPTVTKVAIEKVLYGHALASDASTKKRKEREGIDFAVLNGTETSGVARDVAGTLGDLGYNLAYCRVADRTNYPRSLIVYSPGQVAKAQKMAQAYGYCDIVEAKRPLDVDVQLIVGNDYVLRQDRLQ